MINDQIEQKISDNDKLVQEAARKLKEASDERDRKAVEESQKLADLQQQVKELEKQLKDAHDALADWYCALMSKPSEACLGGPVCAPVEKLKNELSTAQQKLEYHSSGLESLIQLAKVNGFPDFSGDDMYSKLRVWFHHLFSLRSNAILMSKHWKKNYEHACERANEAEEGRVLQIDQIAYLDEKLDKAEQMLLEAEATRERAGKTRLEINNISNQQEIQTLCNTGIVITSGLPSDLLKMVEKAESALSAAVKYFAQHGAIKDASDEEVLILKGINEARLEIRQFLGKGGAS
jgi:hypothetical protein